MQKRAIFVQVLGRQGFPRLVLEYAAQGNPQSDDEIAKKRRFWTRTSPHFSAGVYPFRSQTTGVTRSTAVGFGASLSKLCLPSGSGQLRLRSIT